MQSYVSGLEENIKRVDVTAIREARRLLEDFFYVEIDDTPLQLRGEMTFPFPVAVLRKFREPLMRYIEAIALPSYETEGLVSIADIDHGMYVADFVEKTYDPQQYPVFAAFDKQIHRQGLEWKVSLAKQPGELVVRSIRSLL